MKEQRSNKHCITDGKMFYRMGTLLTSNLKLANLYDNKKYANKMLKYLQGQLFKDKFKNFTVESVLITLTANLKNTNGQNNTYKN